jgi:hypothetical protein
MASFKLPGDPIKDRLVDYIDQLVIIRPKEYTSMDTSFGKSTVLVCEVLIPEPEKGSGAYLNLGDKVPVFWKGVQAQLDENIGEWTPCYLRKGTDSNPRAYWIDLPQKDDIPVVEAVLGSIDAF